MYKLVKSTFTTNQLKIVNNNLSPGNFELKPLIKRQVGKIKEGLYFTALILSIESTEEQRFPVDMLVDFRGIFEFGNIDDEKNIYEFLKLQAVHIMFPYLRSIVTNLSVTAMMPPIVLPIVDVSNLFKNNEEITYIN